MKRITIHLLFIVFSCWTHAETLEILPGDNFDEVKKQLVARGLKLSVRSPESHPPISTPPGYVGEVAYCMLDNDFLLQISTRGDMKKVNALMVFIGQTMKCSGVVRNARSIKILDNGNLVFEFSAVRTKRIEADEKLWTGNKLTDRQPFPAKVSAIASSWVGYDLLLEEIGGKGRICVARVWESVPLEYRMLDSPKEKAKLRTQDGWIFLTPSIEVNRFSWSIGAWRIGKSFGNEDLLNRVANGKRKGIGEQDAP